MTTITIKQTSGLCSDRFEIRDGAPRASHSRRATCTPRCAGDGSRCRVNMSSTTHSDAQTASPHKVRCWTTRLHALRHDGQPHESGWPYLVDDPAHFSKWVPPAVFAPVFRRAGEENRSAMDTIIAELTQERPIIVLTRLSWSFDWVKPDGIVDEATGEKPDMSRRHAVIAVGHGDVRGQRAVLIRNSWGMAGEPGATAG